jgi:pyruvate/2-oxoglutarate dehydrogenase complex dihydrolipoamide acyltransferase (E2) component
MEEQPATRSELNGLGARVNEIEKMEPRISRSEKDIQTLYTAIECDKKEHVDLRKDISQVGLEIQKSINGLVLKFMAGIAVPTILILAQLLGQSLTK